MAEEDATGVGHTLLGVNGFQAAIDHLDTVVGKLSNAAELMSNTAARSSGGSGGGGNGGLWNAASNWMLGRGSNGGSVTFNGQAAGSSDPSHRAPGPAQTPGWAQAGGNFAQAMANGNGGRGVGGAYNIGNAVAGTTGGLVAAGAVAGLGMMSAAANNGATQQDMYNGMMLAGTATRMYTQGRNSFTMNGVSGSQGMSDFYGGMYVLNSQSGYLQGSAQSNKMQAQAGAMGILDPTSNFSGNMSSMVGFSSNATTNLMKAFGISTYGKDPIQIARQILDRMGAPKGKIPPKILQLLLQPQSGLSVTLENMMAAGAINADEAQAIKAAAIGILQAQNHGMGAGAFDTLAQTAGGNPHDQATQDAQAKLRAMGNIGGSGTTSQIMMNAQANVTADSQSQLGSFASALSDSTRLLNAFRNALNSIPGVQQAAGANTGAGGGLMGKAFGLGSFFGVGASPSGAPLSPGAAQRLLSPGASMLNGYPLTGGKGDGSISANGGSSLGGGDTSLSGVGVGFSELGTLVGSTVTGPGFSGVGTASTMVAMSLTSSTTGGSASGAPNGSSTYGASPSPGSAAPGGNGHTQYGTTPGIPMGRVSPAQAIARIRDMMAHHVDIGVGLCQMRAHEVYGIGNGAPSAAAAWAAAKYKHSFADPPPVGAFVFWGGGYGHVAIYAGGGKVYSPGGPGDLSHWVLCTIQSITQGWGKPLLGWTEDNNGVRVVRPATTQKTSPHPNGHSGGHGTTHASGGSVQTGRGAGMIDGILDPYTSGGGSGYGVMNKTAMIIPGVASGGAVSPGSITRGGSGGSAAPQIVFHKGAVVIQFPGGSAHHDSAATGRALGKAFAQELAQDSRIKALMAGTR